MNEEISEELVLVNEHSGHTLLLTCTSIFQLIIFRLKEKEFVNEIEHFFFFPLGMENVIREKYSFRSEHGNLGAVLCNSDVWE